MGSQGELDDPLLTPEEVGALLRVDPKTVTRWGSTGKLHSIVTPGGHRRFKTSVISAIMNGERAPGGSPTAETSVDELAAEEVPAG